MPGKIPKERQRYMLRVEGALAEVSREVYLEWHGSRRHEKYQRERERKYGVYSLEAEGEQRFFSVTGESTEEAAFQHIYTKKLYEALKKLPEQEAVLIYLLYFEERTVKAAAQVLKCSTKTVQNRRERILKKLRDMLS